MKTVLFIDGEYLHKISLELECNIDFKEFKQAINTYFDGGGPVKIFYYACTKDSLNSTNNVKPLIDWLSYNGFIVRHKDLSENQFGLEHRAFVGVQIAMDAITLKYQDVDVNMVFCVRNAEMKELFETLVHTHYVALLTSDKLKSSQVIRQNVDKTIDIIALNDVNPFLMKRT